MTFNLNASSAVADDALPDGILHPFGVSAPLSGNASGECERVVQDFFAHRRRYLASSSGNRVGGPDIGAGRHCRNIGRGRNEHASGGSLCTARRDIDDDWDLGIEDRLGDSAHRGHQPARRVEKNNQAFGLIVDRAFDARIL